MLARVIYVVDKQANKNKQTNKTDYKTLLSRAASAPGKPIIIMPTYSITF